MADHIIPNSGTKAVSTPDGKGQGCATTKHAYVKPELILLYGNEGAGQATNSTGTVNNKVHHDAGETTTATRGGKQYFFDES